MTHLTRGRVVVPCCPSASAARLILWCPCAVCSRCRVCFRPRLHAALLTQSWVARSQLPHASSLMPPPHHSQPPCVPCGLPQSPCLCRRCHVFVGVLVAADLCPSRFLYSQQKEGGRESGHVRSGGGKGRQDEQERVTRMRATDQGVAGSHVDGAVQGGAQRAVLTSERLRWHAVLPPQPGASLRQIGRQASYLPSYLPTSAKLKPSGPTDATD